MKFNNDGGSDEKGTKWKVYCSAQTKSSRERLLLRTVEWVYGDRERGLVFKRNMLPTLCFMFPCTINEHKISFLYSSFLASFARHQPTDPVSPSPGKPSHSLLPLFVFLFESPYKYFFYMLTTANINRKVLFISVYLLTLLQQRPTSWLFSVVYN